MSGRRAWASPAIISEKGRSREFPGLEQQNCDLYLAVNGYGSTVSVWVRGNSCKIWGSFLSVIAVVWAFCVDPGPGLSVRGQFRHEGCARQTRRE
jgi:hypothetical protein